MNQRQIIKRLEELRDKVRNHEEISHENSKEFDSLIKELHKQQRPVLVEKTMTKKEFRESKEFYDKSFDKLIHGMGILVNERLALLTPQERSNYLHEDEDDRWNEFLLPFEDQNDIMRDRIFEEIEKEIFGCPCC